MVRGGCVRGGSRGVVLAGGSGGVVPAGWRGVVMARVCVQTTPPDT